MLAGEDAMFEEESSRVTDIVIEAFLARIFTGQVKKGFVGRPVNILKVAGKEEVGIQIGAVFVSQVIEQRQAATVRVVATLAIRTSGFRWQHETTCLVDDFAIDDHGHLLMCIALDGLLCSDICEDLNVVFRKIGNGLGGR